MARIKIFIQIISAPLEPWYILSIIIEICYLFHFLDSNRCHTKNIVEHNYLNHISHLNQSTISTKDKFTSLLKENFGTVNITNDMLQNLENLSVS